MFDVIPVENHLSHSPKTRKDTFWSKVLKDKSGVDKIIVKKQPSQLLNTNREFFSSFNASNFHKLHNEGS